MDEKRGRRLKMAWGGRWRQLKDVGSIRPDKRKHILAKGLKFLRTHNQPLLTTLLLTVIVVLLFGVFSQLKPPLISTTPNGITEIDYSAFVQQVNEGNVQAVIFQGDAINGLLATPISANNTVNTSPANTQNISGDILAWTRYIKAGASAWPNAATIPAINQAQARMIYVSYPASGDASLMPLLLSKHILVSTISAAQTPLWMVILSKSALFILLGIGLLVFLNSRNSNRSSRPIDDRITQMGKSRARRFHRNKEAEGPKSTMGTRDRGLEMRQFQPPKKTVTQSTIGQTAQSRIKLTPPVTFLDVAGIDEVRTELEEIVQFLHSPERFERLGAKIPKGALLVGPPGTGKTLLAKAIAGEAGVPFFSMSASEFVEMFVGVGASRVRDLFQQARQAAPCVVFLDEIDAVGRKRSQRITGSDERDQTLNQLLVELDGFDSRKAVVVLAATNRADILDKALLRPGRFDRHITVSLPDRAGRQAILKVHTRNTPLHEEVSLERLSRITTGMSGADLANLVNEAALTAARRDLEQITQSCFEDALARVQLGALRPLVLNEAERRIIAYHEGGHALVAYHLHEADTVNCVTILPRGQSLGVTQFTAEEDRYNYSRQTLMARIAVGLGGRAAEELTFGPDYVTTGAENDLQVVTDLARRMVTRWGMSEQVGVVYADYRAEAASGSLNMRRTEIDAFPPQSRSLVADKYGRLMLNGDDPATRQYRMAMSVPSTRIASSVSMATLIDQEVQRILNEGRLMARTILQEHAAQLTLLADTLMEHEQLNRKQFEELLQS